MNVKRLAADSTDAATIAQIISRAVAKYAVGAGYILTQSGIVGAGDEVVAIDGSKLVITKITDTYVYYNDDTYSPISGREAWRLTKVEND